MQCQKRAGPELKFLFRKVEERGVNKTHYKLREILS